MNHLQMVNRQLQYLRLLQLRRPLFLAGGGDQALELREAGVDAVPPLLLDDPAPPLARQQLTGVAAGRAEGGRGGLMVVKLGRYTLDR